MVDNGIRSSLTTVTGGIDWSLQTTTLNCKVNPHLTGWA